MRKIQDGGRFTRAALPKGACVVSIAVISSIYGNYDRPLIPPLQHVDCDWIMVTEPDTPLPRPWRPVGEYRPGLHPRLAAKLAKCRPDLYTDADVTIWIDGCVEIHTSDFVSWCLDALGDAELAQHHSVGRCSLIGEAAVAKPMRKYQGLPLHEQAQSYVDAGHPDDWGLWWTGLIVRRRTCPDFGSPWLVEMLRWSYEDQISQAPVLRKLGLRPVDIPIEWPSHRFTRREHASDL